MGLIDYIFRDRVRERSSGSARPGRDSGRNRGGSAVHGTDFLSVFLLLVAAAILFVILAVTVWAFASGRARPGFPDGDRSSGVRHESSSGKGRDLFDKGIRNPAPDDVIASDPAGKTAVFADIGILRARTADSLPVTVVVSPFIPYPSDDIAFREELVSKTRIMRSFVLGWFASRAIGEIAGLGEAGVKKSLIEGINSNLVLGQIDAIYFEEYLVIE